MFSGRHIVLILCCCSAVSCGDGGQASGAATAVQLVLTPELNTVATVVKEVHRLDVVVDAAEGLNGVTQAGLLPGGGVAIDWDSDGRLETRFTTTAASGQLPVIEIGLEKNAGRALSFRIFGFASQEEADFDRAIGEGGASVAVPAGEVRRVGAPFNLRPLARPPQVVMVLPADAAEAPPYLGTILVALSTTVKTETLNGNILLTRPDGTENDLTVKSETATVAATTFSNDQRSLLTIEFAPLTKPGLYRLQIGPGIESTTDLRFDQDPNTDTEDPFVSQFVVPDLSVGVYGPCDHCPSGYVCDNNQRCVPDRGKGARCVTGFVWDATQQQCVQDCRTNAFCFDIAASCNAQNGLCEK